MIELHVSGPDRRQRIRMPLLPDKSYEVGRAPEVDLPIPWDAHISRHHVRLKSEVDFVDVERLSHAANPLFFAGNEVQRCRVQSGHSFVLGSTEFKVVRIGTEPLSPIEKPLEELTFDPKELQKVRYRDADNRINVLSRLPEVIWGARTDLEFHDRLTSLLLAGVARSDAVAIVRLAGEKQTAVDVVHGDRRRETAGEFRPSRRLVHDSLVDRKRTVLHTWHPNSPLGNDQYTSVAELDWAFCTPVAAPSGNPWGLYVAGALGSDSVGANLPSREVADLQADVKFTELVAEIISSVQRLKNLEQQQSGLRRYFPANVLSLLGDNLDTEVLAPRECDVAVMFCDLRGFSHKAEQSADDLIGLLERVSAAMEVMQRQIDQFGGVTADFQGDATLGFWGWPFASDEAPLNACRAALGIRRAFAEISQQEDHPLANFEVGIGIAHGRAVAGEMGTADQVKVTVFGPVVNLASRLEGMTKKLRVPIVLGDTAANAVRERFGPDDGRIRRLAKILPYGMDKVVEVSELVPPLAEFPSLSDKQLADYDEGVDHFVAGRWEDAYACLHKMPTTDRAQDFLGMLIAQNNRIAPSGWDGIIRLTDK